jgi:hypothetical protein
MTMEAAGDFEDMLEMLDKHKVRYIIIGGLAFIYHAKPRYTKEMELWIDPSPENAWWLYDASRLPPKVVAQKEGAANLFNLAIISIILQDYLRE